jgi:hypothetical protein
MFESVRRRSSGAASQVGILLLAVAALVGVAALAAADSTPRRQYRDTHVGVAPSDLVVLSSAGVGTNLKFYRVQPDGTIGASEFSVPTGYRLVVTDVEWVADSNVNNFTAVLRVFVENKTTSTTRSVVCIRPVASYFQASSGGTYTPAGGSSGTLTGFSVSSSGRLTADVAAGNGVSAAYPATTPVGSAANNTLVVLRGYLVPDA